MMKITLAAAFACCTLRMPMFGQKFDGRWDLTLTPATGKPYPQWMEVAVKDGKVEGRVQPRGGAWKEIQTAKVENGHLLLLLPNGLI